jgi:hypothetical protein
MGGPDFMWNGSGVSYSSCLTIFLVECPVSGLLTALLIGVFPCLS